MGEDAVVGPSTSAFNSIETQTAFHSIETQTIFQDEEEDAIERSKSSTIETQTSDNIFEWKERLRVISKYVEEIIM